MHEYHTACNTCTLSMKLYLLCFSVHCPSVHLHLDKVFGPFRGPFHGPFRGLLRTGRCIEHEGGGGSQTVSVPKDGVVLNWQCSVTERHA